ncbi:MAG: hypothetical protein M5R41_13645 [Bacteroidia bacterium]|nr:hypothetical protein [Bacteroidia bacterium]
MIKTLFLLLLSLLWLQGAQAQFRGQEPKNPSVAEGVTRPAATELSIFSLDRLEMHHSVTMSYGMIGDHGLGSSMYINSLRYSISEPLSVRADIGMMLTTFGSASSFMRNDISRIFLKRASVDYVPSKDFRLTLQYRNEPYLSRYGGWNNGLGFGYDLFDGDELFFR